MSTTQFLTAESLRIPGVAHGFFTRVGGASQGVYASLNAGVGSRDAPEAVTENRARVADALGAAPERLAVPFQIHSPDAVAISEPWPADARPRCDALVTATPGLALGVTGADCGMILFADQRARVIGAAHAGWKGALTGVIEAAVTAMERLGARRGDVVAGLGPCIGPRSYEVGPEFVAAFENSGERPGPYFTAASEKAARCSTSTPISPTAPRALDRTLRGSSSRHLRRRTPLLQLSPRHASEGTGLWPADVGYRNELDSCAFGCLTAALRANNSAPIHFVHDRRRSKTAAEGTPHVRSGLGEPLGAAASPGGRRR